MSHSTAALPIEAVVAAATRRSLLRVDGDALYWLEQRPSEQGRSVIVRWHARTGAEVITPPALNARSRVHEYGGGEFAVHNGNVVFVADPNQQCWLRTADGQLRLLLAPTEPAGAVRFADFAWHPNGQWLYAVRERHGHDGVMGNGAIRAGVINELVAISLAGECVVLADAADFFAAPCVSPDGKRLAWLQWSHPQMPWDGSALMLAELADASALNVCRQVAGHSEESVLQPGFTADGRLLAITDRHGFWQLGEVGESGWRVLTTLAADCAVAPWSLGTRTWAEGPAGSLLLLATRAGFQQLLRLTAPGAVPVTLPWGCLAPHLACDDSNVYMLAANPQQAEAVVRIELATGAAQPLSSAAPWPAEVDIAVPELLEVAAGDRLIPAWFYRPANAIKPPLVAFCHSGPTGQASPTLQAAIQFWTSRGYAVVDINYRGSDGYGRRWRQALLGHWGEYDVADCLAVITHLLGNDAVDAQRIYLRGNSAGGLTALQLLAQSRLIRAAALRYPVVDLPALAHVSHKFEAHYLHRLVGVADESPAALAPYSPANQLHCITTPLLIQQGDQDPVVPSTQARLLADTLTARGVSCELKLHAGEGHGFRRAETLAAALQAELDFFEQH